MVASGCSRGDDSVTFGPEGELRVALAAVRGLDPAAASPASVSEMMMADLLYDTLTELDEDGYPVPGLASFSSADRAVWRFELLPEAEFGDGRPVTAADVVFTLQRIRAQKDTLAGLQLEQVEAIDADGDRAVVVRLAEPSAVFPEILSSPAFGIVAPGAGEGDTGRPMTSSGYAAEVTASGEITLRGGGSTRPRTVVIELHETETEAYEALVAGDVDWAPVPVGRVDDAIGRFGGDGLVPFAATVMLGINDRVFPLGDDRLRRALVLGVDRAALTEAVLGPTGQALVGLVPDGVPGSTSECDDCGPDPESVSDLVDQVFPTGQVLPLRLLTDQSELQSAVAEVLVDQWASAGIEVRSSALEPTVRDQVVTTGQHQLFLFPTLGLSRSPSVHLAPLFRSTSADNLGGYSRPDVDQRIAQALAEPSASRRSRLWSRIERRILADHVVVPLVQLRILAAHSDRIRGMVVRVDGSVDLSDLEFAQR